MELLESRIFDIVQIEFPMMWQYAGLVKDIPIVLDMHNIEYQLIRQMKEASSNVLKKLLYGWEEAKLMRLEHDAWQECDLCVAVSDKERNIISAHLKKDNKIITIANGVDLERFEYMPKKTSEKYILFIGSMDYIPTIDSTDYLLEEIFPLILSKIKNVKLHIVGRSLWRIRDKVSAEGVLLHENVPDIIPFLRKADVLIDPLRLGAGTRLKILEAMAAGVPVVTTSKGCEGIMVQNGEHLLIADFPADFADATVKLLTDRELSDSLTVNARQLVEKHYSWEKVVQALETDMRELV
jgi:glycosyltransferase involved in cell wall biosynthesis